MAELTATDSNLTDANPSSSCCSTEAQDSCCEPSAKDECCGPSATADGGCGCSATEADSTDIRETVRAKYAQAATEAARGEFKAARELESQSASGDPDFYCCSPADQTGVFGSALYDEANSEQLPDPAVQASLGCGVPTAVADLHEGETVLDLGSGAGADALISARRVGPSGKAIGLDMTDEMLELARRNAAEAGVENIEFLKGYLEQLPLPDASVDVVISNCVINLSGDKPRVLAEAARVLRPDGRFAVSDVIADPEMDEATKADMQAWTGCIAGALTEQEFRDQLTAAGLTDIEVKPTHRVHEFASAAIIRARKPSEASVPASVEPAHLALFEPAMCCSSGVCGPSVDQALLDIREHLRWAEAQGASVTRHNLSSDPDAFVANPKVTGLMAAFGEPALPALLVDGEIKLHGRYPSRDELAGFLEAPSTSADQADATDGCGCGPSGCC